nr:MAG TPA: hypothetical protein [Caudoviricetes sp.]
MIKIENVITPSGAQWKSIIMGARNPLNSWERSDSHYDVIGRILNPQNANEIFKVEVIDADLGINDLGLLKRLSAAGTDHRKFMRMITVYLDITAPLYWWKEFDTYKVGTVANSCSTMHKIHSKEFTLDDFSHEHLSPDSLEALEFTIKTMNTHRKWFIDKPFNDDPKIDWWQMIQLLPSSYNQKRTVMMNYEVLANMYKSRRNHKLDEWVEFCKWIETLPYSELITGKDKEEQPNDGNN